MTNSDSEERLVMDWCQQVLNDSQNMLWTRPAPGDRRAFPQVRQDLLNDAYRQMGESEQRAIDMIHPSDSGDRVEHYMDKSAYFGAAKDYLFALGARLPLPPLYLPDAPKKRKWFGR